jgi:hypothetical protein
MSDRLPGTSWSNPLKYRQYVIYVEPEAAKDEIDLLVIEGQ